MWIFFFFMHTFKLQFSMFVVLTKYMGCICKLCSICSYQSFMQTIMNMPLFSAVCTVIVNVYSKMYIVYTVLNTKCLMKYLYVIGPGTPLYLCLSLYSYVAFYYFLPTQAFCTNKYFMYLIWLVTMILYTVYYSFEIGNLIVYYISLQFHLQVHIRLWYTIKS